MNEGSILNILNNIYKDIKPTKENPLYWMQGGFTYMNNGDGIYIKMNDGSFQKINQYERGN